MNSNEELNKQIEESYSLLLATKDSLESLYQEHSQALTKIQAKTLSQTLNQIEPIMTSLNNLKPIILQIKSLQDNLQSMQEENLTLAVEESLNNYREEIQTKLANEIQSLPPILTKTMREQLRQEIKESTTENLKNLEESLTKSTKKLEELQALEKNLISLSEEINLKTSSMISTIENQILNLHSQQEMMTTKWNSNFKKITLTSLGINLISILIILTILFLK